MSTNHEIDIIKDIHHWNKYMSNYFLNFDIRQYHQHWSDRHDIFCWVSALLHEGYDINNINSIIKNSGFEMKRNKDRIMLKNKYISLDIGRYF